MRKIAGLVLLVSACTSVHAQIPTKGNIFVGYSNSGGDVFSAPDHPTPGVGLTPGQKSTNFNGWEGSLEGKFVPWFGLVTDISAHYGSQRFAVVCGVIPPCSPATVDSTRYTVLFGPRVSVSVGRFTPFAHGLIGVGHQSDSKGTSNSSTALASAIGGGLDYKLIKGLAWRVQGDELHTHFFGNGQNYFRFSTGIVLRF